MKALSWLARAARSSREHAGLMLGVVGGAAIGAVFDIVTSERSRRIVTALGIGSVGALIAHALHVPLAFMLGSLFATMAASLSGVKLAAPQRLRQYCLIIVGLFLAESFSVDAVGRMLDWWPSMLLALAYPILVGWLSFIFYVRVAGLGHADAFFSATPGGLSGVVLLSSAYGADERLVALTQSLRVCFVVLAAPLLFFGVLGYAEPPAPPGDATQVISVRDALILAAGSAVGIWAASRAGMPLAHMIAPLAIGAALRLGGVVDGVLPEILVEAALIVVGASIGGRFAGANVAALMRLAGWTLAATAAMAAASVLFAVFAAWTTGAPFLVGLLAYAPGGVAEMTLIAIALELDPSFVAAHHLARIAFILLMLPIVAPLFMRSLEPKAAPVTASSDGAEDD